MSDKEVIQTRYLRIESALWLLFFILVALRIFAEGAGNAYWSSFMLFSAGISILLILLTKVIKNIQLKKTIRIVIYTVLLLLFIYLFFIFPGPF
ncbi:hypothetical protein [Corticicoccus populi]|uniref:Uncharacterized protein n=1 Tax=Corticicoccus populi TaxID=1812821 RepID=A0ABW5WWM3_9STAP